MGFSYVIRFAYIASYGGGLTLASLFDTLAAIMTLKVTWVLFIASFLSSDRSSLRHDMYFLPIYIDFRERERKRELMLML